MKKLLLVVGISVLIAWCVKKPSESVDTMDTTNNDTIATGTVTTGSEDMDSMDMDNMKNDTITTGTGN